MGQRDRFDRRWDDLGDSSVFLRYLVLRADALIVGVIQRTATSNLNGHRVMTVLIFVKVLENEFLSPQCNWAREVPHHHVLANRRAIRGARGE